MHQIQTGPRYRTKVKFVYRTYTLVEGFPDILPSAFPQNEATFDHNNPKVFTDFGRILEPGMLVEIWETAHKWVRDRKSGSALKVRAYKARILSTEES
jgi:hypothetical protein